MAPCSSLQESGGHCSELTRRISGIGTHGKHGGNCERDLFRILNLPIEFWLYLNIYFWCIFTESWGCQGLKLTKLVWQSFSQVRTLFLYKCLFWTLLIRTKKKERFFGSLSCFLMSCWTGYMTLGWPNLFKRILFVSQVLLLLFGCIYTKYQHVPPTCEVSKKIHVPPEQIAEFWRHWSQHMPFHPASASANRYPIGVSGDDAKYTLSGMKFIVVMVSSVLYKVKRDHAARRFLNFISNNNQRFEQLHAYLVLQPLSNKA